MEELSGQVSSFVLTVLTGVAWGILYDFFQLCNGSCRAGRRRSGLNDLLFWLFSVVLVGTGLIISNWLELRFFVVLGLMLGLVIYGNLGRPFVRPILRWFRELLGLMLYPLVKFRYKILIDGRLLTGRIRRVFFRRRLMPRAKI